MFNGLNNTKLSVFICEDCKHSTSKYCDTHFKGRYTIIGYNEIVNRYYTTVDNGWKTVIIPTRE